MNIHYVGNARVPTPRGHRPNNTAKPPRTRVNTNTKLAHNAYPGGKRYRKAMARLKARRNAHPQPKGQEAAFVVPGSMKA